MSTPPLTLMCRVRCRMTTYGEWVYGGELTLSQAIIARDLLRSVGCIAQVVAVEPDPLVIEIAIEAAIEPGTEASPIDALRVDTTVRLGDR